MGARIKSPEEPFVESVRVLRLEQNALAPISSLPPEILAIIFSFLCWQSLGRDSGHNLAPIRLSHVCRHWREIALNQSLLWSHVDFTAPPSLGQVQRRNSLVPSRHHYILRQSSLSDAGTVFHLIHSERNSRRASPTYATMALEQMRPSSQYT